MRALVVDPSAPDSVRLTEVPSPTPTGDDILIAVRHAALNYGDLNDARSGRVPPGAVLGSDVAGVVLEPGPSGPPPGTRVVALAAGAFAEQAVARPGPLLALGGNLQSIGWASGEPAVFPPYSTIGPAKTLTSFLNVGSASDDLAVLVRLVDSGALPVEIGWRGPLDQFAEATDALRNRRINGKAILDVA